MKAVQLWQSPFGLKKFLTVIMVMTSTSITCLINQYSVLPARATDVGFTYKVPININLDRQSRGYPLLSGTYDFDTPVLADECRRGNRQSCQIAEELSKACAEYCKNVYPDLMSSENMACVFQGCYGLQGSTSGASRGSHNSQSESNSSVGDCYANCDEKERNCNKINRFFNTPGGSQECAAERRSCDARCR